MSLAFASRYPSRTLETVYALVSTRPRCPACGNLPDISEHGSANAADRAFLATCHGAHELLRIPAEVIYGDWHKVQRVVWDWFDRMFKLDALPDMRELYRYNQGKV